MAGAALQWPRPRAEVWRELRPARRGLSGGRGRRDCVRSARWLNDHQVLTVLSTSVTRRRDHCWDDWSTGAPVGTPRTTSPYVAATRAIIASRVN